MQIPTARLPLGSLLTLLVLVMTAAACGEETHRLPAPAEGEGEGEGVAEGEGEGGAEGEGEGGSEGEGEGGDEGEGEGGTEGEGEGGAEGEGEGGAEGEGEGGVEGEGEGVGEGEGEGEGEGGDPGDGEGGLECIDDGTVTWFSRDPAECDGALVDCPPNRRWISGPCGCGCAKLDVGTEVCGVAVELPPACEQGELGALVAGMWDSATMCDDSDDCVVVEDLRLDWCVCDRVAANRAADTDLIRCLRTAWVQSYTQHDCPLPGCPFPPPEACQGVPRCVEGRCRIADPAPR